MPLHMNGSELAQLRGFGVGYGCTRYTPGCLPLCMCVRVSEMGPLGAP